MAAQFSQTTRSLAGDTARYAITAWLLGGVFLAGWMIWFVLGAVTVYEVSQEARLEVRQSAHPIAAQVAGKVVSTALAIGAEVKAGDILLALDNSSETLRLKEEETRLETIPRQIASLQREIQSREQEKASDLRSAMAATEAARFRGREADAAVGFAKDYEQRLTELGATGLVSSLDVTRASTDRLKLTASRDSLSSDVGRIALDAQTHASQHDALIESLRHSVTSLEGDMATARATIARLTIDLEKHLVRAPISGRLGDVAPVQTGAFVAEGLQLATVVPAGDLVIVANFSPSLALGRVRAGQHGRLRLTGFPWAQYGSIPATVTGVASEIRDRSVRVELSLDSGSADTVPMQHGLPGSVEVSVEHASPAVLVLRAAGLLLSTPTNDNSALARSAR